MAAFVVDASVLAALYVADPASEASDAALDRLSADGEFHAPDLALLEVGNVLRKRVGRGEVDAQDAMAAIGDLAAASIRYHAAGPLAPQALALAMAHRLTVYDAAYVALATRVGATLLTNDGGLRQRGVEAGLPIVRPEDLP